MSEQKFISRFSPNRTGVNDLEQINVQAEDLLRKSVELLRESALTDNKHHLLFIGPRGCGKTHLLTLIAHRLKAQPELANNLLIAWLNEDETSTSFLDLLIRIYRSLAGDKPKEFPLNDLEKLFGRSPEEAQKALSEMLIRQFGRRTVLVLVENLDALFRQFEVAEQHTWRAFIQNHPVFATAATAQSLFSGVSNREEPFFGFFDITHLNPLTVEQAIELLQRIAQLNANQELVEFLNTPRGRARVHAIHHLSGGNQRLYIVLSDFIQKESLDELVRPFEEMVDEQLTPYYQERLRWLSPQQRKIVEFLCQQSRPVPVKDIADRLFATHSSITNQLKQLREMGYVVPNPRGRESLYELAEPLMRLSMQVKEDHEGQPLRLIVDFLRVWYERDELVHCLAGISAATPEREYFTAALAKLRPSEPNLRHQLLRDGFEAMDLVHCDRVELETLRELAQESRDVSDWLKYGNARRERSDYTEAIDAFSEALKLSSTSTEEIAKVLNGRGLSFLKAGRTENAIADFTSLIELSGAPVEDVAKALNNRGIAFGNTGRTENEIADYTRLIELPDAPVEQIAKALFNRGVTFEQTSKTENAIADYSRLIEQSGAPVEQVAKAFIRRGIVFRKEGKVENEIADYSHLIELLDAPVEQIAKALFRRGIAFGEAGKIENEIADYTHLIGLPGAPVKQVVNALFRRAYRFGKVGRTEEEITDYMCIIELPGAPIEDVVTALSFCGHTLKQANRAEDAINIYTRLIDLPGTPIDKVASALLARGLIFWDLGRAEEEIADYNRLIELPGAPVDNIASALFCRGFALGRAGSVEREIADYTRLIKLPEAPVDTLTMALVNRGIMFAKAKRSDDAISDFKIVIDLQGAPVEQVAKALLTRGTTFVDIGQSEDAIADFTRLIDLPGAPVEQVAKALITRGLNLLQKGRPDISIPDYERVIAMPGVPIQQLLVARCVLAQFLIMSDQWSKGVEHLRYILSGRAKSDAVLPLISDAVVKATFLHIASPKIWRARCIELSDLYAEYDCSVYLGDSLVRHLGQLAENLLSNEGLDGWLEGWESSSKDDLSMQLALRLLRAGISYLKTKPRDGGVLLALPMEERQLVRQALKLPLEKQE